MESLVGLGTATQEELDARREAESRGEPFLIYRDDEGRQRLHVLGSERRSVTLGRRHEADVSVPWDPEMSRLHAELELHAGEWTICDDGFSQNGTWVNGLRLSGRRRLLDGDLLRVGRTMFAFCAPSTEDLRPTLVPGELGGTPRFSEQQQRVLRGLCRPLLGDGDGVAPATDDEIARRTGIPAETVTTELDHLTRALGIQDASRPERRRELALIALRSGLVAADENG